MDWKNQLTKTPYLVLFIVLISIGVGTASALITITLSGNVVITGDATLQGDLTCTDCIDSNDIEDASISSQDIGILNNLHVGNMLLGELACDTLTPSDTGCVDSNDIEDGSITSDDLSTSARFPDVYSKSSLMSSTGFTQGLNCDPGDLALTGGYGDVEAASNVKFSRGTILVIGGPPVGWSVQVSPAGDLFRIQVVCADFDPPHTP